MKMIASTKLAKAQRAMTAGKEYGIANSGVPPPLPYLHWARRLTRPSSLRNIRPHPLGDACQAQTLHRRFLGQGSLRWYPLLRLKSHPPCDRGHREPRRCRLSRHGYW